ncbi:hypothetical protein D3C75_883550 [compost metagenome]
MLVPPGERFFAEFGGTFGQKRPQSQIAVNAYDETRQRPHAEKQHRLVFRHWNQQTLERGYKGKAGKSQGKVAEGNIQLHQIGAACGQPQIAGEGHGNGNQKAVSRLVDEDVCAVRHDPEKGDAQHRQECQQKKADAPVALQHIHTCSPPCSKDYLYLQYTSYGKWRPKNCRFFWKRRTAAPG